MGAAIPRDGNLLYRIVFTGDGDVSLLIYVQSLLPSHMHVSFKFICKRVVRVL